MSTQLNSWRQIKKDMHLPTVLKRYNRVVKSFRMASSKKVNVSGNGGKNQTPEQEKRIVEA